MPLIQDYDYLLPPELVAQYPLEKRDSSRLLVLRRDGGEIIHTRFWDLPQWLDSDDVLVVNDTRVFPARLNGHKDSGGKVELLLHHLPEAEGNGAGADAALVQATHRGSLRVGQCLHLGADLTAKVLALPEPGVVEVRFTSPSGDTVQAVLEAGEVPLPPYIQRAAGAADRDAYQTVFAAQAGAVACPTAGLHFTDTVLHELAERGIETVRLTLHVGPGTFMPVRHQDYTRHRMLPEYFEFSEAAASRLNDARTQGKRIVAVGSTSVRVLEHCATSGGFQAQQGWCDLYIYPGYRFQAVNRMLTNFHLPKSTLLLLVSAFAGRDLILQAYTEAIKEGYRFYSYGDCMLIL
ncbi:MAG: tRNA preQ1(34) S-adenosylmethionine ribosyltransferase-isomerase QueA [Thermodesulfobacteriota bacterium]